MKQSERKLSQAKQGSTWCRSERTAAVRVSFGRELTWSNKGDALPQGQETTRASVGGVFSEGCCLTLQQQHVPADCRSFEQQQPCSPSLLEQHPTEGVGSSGEEVTESEFELPSNIH